MLVLTRRVGESIIINGNIEVMIIDIRKGQVKMGFNADIDISINREEIQKKINIEKNLSDAWREFSDDGYEFHEGVR